MKRLAQILFILLLCLTLPIAAYGSWGWTPTDDPVPFYYQQQGCWYHYDETTVFMVQLQEHTYKYVFNQDGTLLNGWVTDMPMRLP